MRKISYALANPVDRVVHVCENILTSHLLREALADVLFEKYKVRAPGDWQSPLIDASVRSNQSPSCLHKGLPVTPLKAPQYCLLIVDFAKVELFPYVSAQFDSFS
jgi:hypothetical protein